MKKSKELENFVDKIQEKIQKDLQQITKSIDDIDVNFLEGYRNAAVNSKKHLEEIIKQQDDVLAIYDTHLTDWALIYNKEKTDAKSLHRYLSMWFVSRRLWKLQEKLSMGYCIEELLKDTISSIDEIIKMIDKRLESEK